MEELVCVIQLQGAEQEPIITTIKAVTLYCAFSVPDTMLSTFDPLPPFNYHNNPDVYEL